MELTSDDYVRLQILLERFKASESKSFMRLVTALDNSVKEVLAAGELSEMSQPAVAKINSIVDNRLRDLGSGIIADIEDRLRNFVREQAKIEANLLGIVYQPRWENLAFNVPIGIDGADRGSNVGAFIDHWWRDIRSKVFGAINRGAFEKIKNSGLNANIRGTRALHYKDGLLDTIRRSAVGTTNTAIQHLGISVRELLMQSTGTKKVMWSAMLESKTCPRCGALDGRVFEINKGPRPPLHHSCRCIMMPFDDRKEIVGTTFFDWLKGQNEANVIASLGQTKARLFLRGGFSATDFSRLLLDKKFEPLTLDEIRKISPSIFARAGV